MRNMHSTGRPLIPRPALRHLTGKRRKQLLGLAFTAPFLLGFFAFYLVPFLLSAGQTFTRQGRFAGLAVYADVLGSDAFRLAAFNTFRFIAVGVPLIMAASLWLALLFYRRFMGAGGLRLLYLLPLVVPVASTVMVVQVFFAQSGMANGLLAALGLPVQSWLQSEWAFALLLALYLWKNIGYNIVLLLAGLNAIPRDYFETAALEGAGGFTVLRRVILPLLAPNLVFVFVVSVVNAFKSFREAFLLGGDYPHSSIYMLQHFMNNNFRNLSLPRLTVAAYFVFAVIFILVLVLLRHGRREGGELL